MAAFWPIGTAQIIRIVSYPIRKKSTFWLFWMWSVKEMYHALFPKTDYRDKGRGHDCRLVGEGRAHKQASKHCSRVKQVFWRTSHLGCDEILHFQRQAKQASLFCCFYNTCSPPPQKNSLFRLGIVYIKGPLQIRVKARWQPFRAQI